MSEEKNKWIDAIAKMIELTQRGKLEWKLVPQSAIPSGQSDLKIDIMFRASYKGKFLRLFRHRYTASRLKSGVNPLFGIFARNPDEFESYTESQVVLEFVTSEGQSIWRYPEVSALSDLLSTIQFQAAGVKDFMSDILSETLED